MAVRARLVATAMAMLVPGIACAHVRKETERLAKLTKEVGIKPQ